MDNSTNNGRQGWKVAGAVSSLMVPLLLIFAGILQFRGEASEVRGIVDRLRDDVYHVRQSLKRIEEAMLSGQQTLRERVVRVEERINNIENARSREGK